MNALRFLTAFLLTLALFLSATPSRAADEASGHRPGLRDQWQPQTEHDRRLAQPVRIEILGRAAVPALEMLSKETGVTLQVAPEDLDTVGERKLTIIAQGLDLKSIMVQLCEALQECHWDIVTQGGQATYLLHRNAGVEYLSEEWLDRQKALERRPLREARIAEARRALAMSPEELAELEKPDLYLARSVRLPETRARLELFLTLPESAMQQLLDTGDVDVDYPGLSEPFRRAADRILEANASNASAPGNAKESMEIARRLQADPSALQVGYQEFQGGVFIRVSQKAGKRTAGGGFIEPVLWPRCGWTIFGDESRHLLVATGAPDEKTADELFAAWEAKGAQRQEEREARWTEPADQRLHRAVALPFRRDEPVEFLDVERAVAAESGLSVISDYFVSFFMPLSDEARAAMPLWRLLYVVGEERQYRWKQAGDCLALHHAEWYSQAAGEVPERIILAYREKLKTQDRFTLDDMAALALALGGRPIRAEAMPADLARAGISAGPLPARPLLLYATLSPAQVARARGPKGLPFADMTKAQQERARQSAASLAPPVPADQVSQAVFRVQESLLGDRDTRLPVVWLDIQFPEN
jgi:hypothetical protein